MTIVLLIIAKSGHEWGLDHKQKPLYLQKRKNTFDNCEENINRYPWLKVKTLHEFSLIEVHTKYYI